MLSAHSSSCMKVPTALHDILTSLFLISEYHSPLDSIRSYISLFVLVIVLLELKVVIAGNNSTELLELKIWQSVENKGTEQNYSIPHSH